LSESLQANSVSSQSAVAAQCPCGRAVHPVIISEEDKQLISALRELKPLIPFLRDFARSAGSLGKIGSKLADVLKS